MVRGLLQKKVARYVLVGGMVYVFELWVIVWAQRRGATPTEAVALSFTLGLIVSFFLQKLFTFGDTRMHHKIVFRQALAVALLVVWNLCFTVIVTKITQSFIPATVARTIALLITTVWNFYLYKTRIFSPSHPVIRVEKPSLLLGIKQTPLHRTSMESLSELPTPKHESKMTSFVIVCLCAGLLAALISAATVMRSIEDAAAKPKQTTLETINDTGCAHRTVMQIVAHQDDDLLFMNPDLQKSIAAGDCIRTVYLTAGNAGMGLAYAKEREKGAQAAYSTMLSEKPGKWRRHFIRVTAKSSVETAVPATNTNVSLIFYRLPDGGIKGGGYDVKGSPPRSLAGLLKGTKPSLTTVDGRAVYTEENLIASLSSLMARYKPAEIRVQAVLPEERSSDHSDHYAGGWIARQAFAQYKAAHPDITTTMTYYMGYPDIQRQENVTGEELLAKESAFLAYAKFDGSVCQTTEDCTYGDNAYVKYLPRMYTLPESEIYSWPEK